MPTPTHASLIEMLRAAFKDMPDSRCMSNATIYQMIDAGLSAFSIFFTQSPSFLDWQIRMQQEKGRNNANSLFGVHKIPTDAQIRNLLDPVPADTLFPLMSDIGNLLHDNGYIDSYRSLSNTFLVALDGTDTFSSENISCPCCSQFKLKNGNTLYRHIAVTPVIVAPGHSKVIPLPPQFVQPQDGHDKQDCEISAAKRWLNVWGAHYAAWKMTILGDDLYCHEPFCRQTRLLGFHFLFTCKPDSHQTLYEWVDELQRIGKISTLIVPRRVGKQHYTDSYRFAGHLPLTNSDDALLVDWCELITTDVNGKVTYQNSWATSHTINKLNVVEAVVAARTRWKIENENNNTLKTKGYHLEHNFGHGKMHLSNLLVTMNLLAFLFHTTLDWIDEKYREVRSKLPSRQTFFEHVRALLHYLPFDSWDHLMTFMLNGGNPESPETG